MIYAKNSIVYDDGVVIPDIDLQCGFDFFLTLLDYELHKTYFPDSNINIWDEVDWEWIWSYFIYRDKKWLLHLIKDYKEVYIWENIDKSLTLFNKITSI